MVTAGLLGMAAGAAAAVYLAAEPPAGDTLSVDRAGGPGSTTTARVEVAPLIQGGLGVASRAAMLEAVGRAEPDTLAFMVDDTARLPSSPERTFLLSVLVTRLAQDDPDGALVLLSEQFLDPRTAREMGLLVLDAMEPGVDSIDLVLVGLPQIDARRFRLQAVAQLAGTRPARAVELALALEGAELRTAALRQAARVWVEQNAGAALAHTASVPEDHRFAYESAALARLARTDMTGTLNYLDERYGDTADRRDRLILAVANGIMRVDPKAAMALTRELTGMSRIRAEMNVSGWLARLDPAAAMAYAQNLPPGGFNQARNRMVRILGEQDADAAVAWVRSLDPMPEELAAEVLTGVARVDPLRAIDLGEELSIVGSLEDVDDLQTSAPQLAARVLAVQDPEDRQRWLRTLVQSWSRIDEQGALDWTLANGQSVGNGVIAELGERWGREDPTLALGYTDRLPANLQEDWLRSLVQGAARDDPEALIPWVAQFRGQAVYDSAASAVVRSARWADAEPAVALFETLSPARQEAVGRGLASNWARQDMPAARQWVAGMPVGPVRDAALAGVVQAFEQAPDAAFLALFDSDVARQEAVVDTVGQLGRRDRAEARKMVDAYLSDPILRQQAEHVLQDLDR